MIQRRRPLLRRTPLKRKPYRQKSPRKPIPKQSKKRKVEARIYAKLRAKFLLDHPLDQVWLKEHEINEDYAIACMGHVRVNGTAAIAPAATEIHHGAKRGKNYLNVATWLAVGREMHDKIENNKSWARERGYLSY